MPLTDARSESVALLYALHWAAPAVVLLLLVCILPRLVVGGLSGVWKALGTTGSSAKRNREDRVRVDVAGKACGVELAGRALHHTKGFTKDNQRARKMCQHARTGVPLEDPQIAFVIANSIVAELKNLCAALGGAPLYVVGEGVAEAKQYEKARRDALAAAHLAAVPPKYAAAVTTTDCTMQLVWEQIEALGDEYNLIFVKPPGEGEAQLMSILSAGVIEYVLLGSGDADASIYSSNQGSILMAWEVAGKVGGRMKHGVAGPRVVALEVKMQGLWDAVRVAEGAPLRDLSGWSFLDRAIMAALIGHDYDSAGDKAAQGVAGVALLTATSLVAGAKTACPPHTGDDLLYVQGMLRHILKAHGRAWKEPDVDRLAFVCFGFFHHPVLDVDSCQARPYSPLQPATATWLQGHNAATANQLAGLGAFDTRSKYVHIGCQGCGTTSAEATAAYAASTLQDAVDSFSSGGAKKMSAEAQPELTTKVLNDHLKKVTPLDMHKIKDEGLERAHDSAQELVSSVTIAYKPGANPPECLITGKVKQSQDRGTYTAAATLVLNAGKAKAVEIKDTICDPACIKRYKEVLCRHRAALLAFLWLNTCTGNAGNPGHRDNYWKGHGLPGVGEEANVVVRAVDIHTNRTKQLKKEELEAMDGEAGAGAGAGAGTVTTPPTTATTTATATVATVETTTLSDVDNTTSSNAARRTSPQDAYPRKKQRIMLHFNSVAPLDTAKANKLLELARRCNVPRLIRKDMWPDNNIPLPLPLPKKTAK